MKRTWYRDWLVYLICFTILTGVLGAISLYQDVGKPYLGVLYEHNLITDKITIGHETPYWWPGFEFNHLTRSTIFWDRFSDWFTTGNPYKIVAFAQAEELEIQVIRQEDNGNWTNPVITVRTMPFENYQYWDLCLPIIILWLNLVLLSFSLYISRPMDPVNRKIVVAFLVAAITPGVFFPTIYSANDGFLVQFLISLRLISGGLAGPAIIDAATFFPSPIKQSWRRRIIWVVYIFGITVTILYLISRILFWVSGWSPLVGQLDYYGFFGSSILQLAAFSFFAARVIFYFFMRPTPRRMNHYGILILGFMLCIPYYTALMQEMGLLKLFAFGLIGVFLLFIAGALWALKKKHPWVVWRLVLFLISMIVIYLTSNIISSNKDGVFYQGIDLRYSWLFIPLSLTYIIARYKYFGKPNRLLGIAFTLVMSAIIASLGATYIYKEYSWIPRLVMRGPPFAELFFLSLGISLFFMFQNMKPGILDRLLHRKQRDYRIVKAFSEQIAGFGNLDALPDRIIQAISQAFNVQHVAYWKWDQAQGFLELINQNGRFQSPLPVIIYPTEGTIPKRPFELHAQGHNLAWLEKLEVISELEVIIPLVAPDTNTPLGIIGLGAIEDEETLDVDDIDILEQVARQISIVSLAAIVIQQRERAYEWASTAEADERARVAREMHDSTLQYFHGQSMVLETLSEILPESHEKAHSLLSRSIEQTHLAADDLREIIQNMAHERLPGNLATILQENISYFSKRNNLEVSLNIELKPGVLPREHELAIYRVVRQALDNIHAHAKAQHATITISEEADCVVFQIIDDGYGFDIDCRKQALEERHFGLWSMEERIQKLGGHLKITSSIGNGTQIQGTLPKNPEKP